MLASMQGSAQSGGKPSWRLALGIGASVGLMAVAFTMPTSWYDALPRRPGSGPLLVRGTTLLQAMLVVQALAVAAWSIWGAPWIPKTGTARIEMPPRSDANERSGSWAHWWLAGITILALVLRTYRIDSDLWIDELTTLNQYARGTVPHVIGSFRTANNHLLISLLMKAAITVFGEQEWSMRLAAVAFGVATIPAVYCVARLVTSHQGSLIAATLLTVSYHHIFFSQNARGYGAYVLFALIGTRALWDALRDDRREQWVLYGAATVLGFLSLLHTVFVVVAQMVIVGWLLRQRLRAGLAIRPTIIRLGLVWTITAFICLEVVAIALPEMFDTITAAYTKASTGFTPTSSAFTAEVLARVADGFAAGQLVSGLPFLLLALGGFPRLWRNHRLETALLLMPGLLTATLLAARGYTFTPRYFLLWLPLGVIAAAIGIETTVGRLRGVSPLHRRWAAMVATATVGVLSALSLPRYYAVPKQPYRQTLRYVESVRHPDDLVMVVHPARYGVRFYGERMHLPLARDYVYVRDVPMLDSVLARRGTRRILLITTLERGATIERPEFMARLRAAWTRDTSFDATIGDGQLSVWSEKSSK